MAWGATWLSYLPMRLSGAYALALSTAGADVRIRQAVGEPMTVDWWIGFPGALCRKNTACFTLGLRGPHGTGHLEVAADWHTGTDYYRPEGWALENAFFTGDQGQSIALVDMWEIKVATPEPTLSAAQIDATQGAAARGTQAAEATQNVQATATQIAQATAADAERRWEGTATASAAASRATATAAPKATSEAIIAAQAAWPVVLSDTFADNHPGWPEGVLAGGPSVTMTVTGGSYVWEGVLKDMSDDEPTYRHAFPRTSAPLTNFAASVTVKIVQGDDDGWSHYGLVFRHAGQEDGFFGVNASGEWWVELRYPVSVPDGPPGYFDTAPAIHAGLGQSNRLTVVAVGPDLIFLVNDQVVHREHLTLPAGDFGVGADWAGTGPQVAVVQFSDFEVRAPK